jgi:hypothetical protein
MDLILPTFPRVDLGPLFVFPRGKDEFQQRQQRYFSDGDDLDGASRLITKVTGLLGVMDDWDADGEHFLFPRDEHGMEGDIYVFKHRSEDRKVVYFYPAEDCEEIDDMYVDSDYNGSAVVFDSDWMLLGGVAVFSGHPAVWDRHTWWSHSHGETTGPTFLSRDLSLASILTELHAVLRRADEIVQYYESEAAFRNDF